MTLSGRTASSWAIAGVGTVSLLTGLLVISAYSADAGFYATTCSGATVLIAASGPAGPHCWGCGAAIFGAGLIVSALASSATSWRRSRNLTRLAGGRATR